MKKVELTDKQIDILVNLVTNEIGYFAELKAEFRAKDVDCGGVSTQIDRLQTILRELTREN